MRKFNQIIRWPFLEGLPKDKGYWFPQIRSGWIELLSEASICIDLLVGPELSAITNHLTVISWFNQKYNFTVVSLAQLELYWPNFLAFRRGWWAYCSSVQYSNSPPEGWGMSMEFLMRNPMESVEMWQWGWAAMLNRYWDRLYRRLESYR